MQKTFFFLILAFSSTSFAGRVVIINKNSWDLKITVFDIKKKLAHLNLKKDAIGCILSPDTINLFVIQNPDGNLFPYQSDIKKGHQICVEAYWNDQAQTYDLKPLKDCPVVCRLTQEKKKR